MAGRQFCPRPGKSRPSWRLMWSATVGSPPWMKVERWRGFERCGATCSIPQSPRTVDAWLKRTGDDVLVEFRALKCIMQRLESPK